MVRGIDSPYPIHSYYSNNGIKISGSAITSLEEDQNYDLLNGGMFLISKPTAEVVQAFSENREFAEYPEITNLFRKAMSNPVGKKVKASEDVWIIGRIPGNANGEPPVWQSQALGTGNFHHSDYFTSGNLYVQVRGPREGVSIPSGNYFLLRLVELDAGMHNLEIFPYYQWEGGNVSQYSLPTQRSMKIDFEVGGK